MGSTCRIRFRLVRACTARRAVSPGPSTRQMHSSPHRRGPGTDTPDHLPDVARPGPALRISALVTLLAHRMGSTRRTRSFRSGPWEAREKTGLGPLPGGRSTGAGTWPDGGAEASPAKAASWLARGEAGNPLSDQRGPTTSGGPRGSHPPDVVAPRPSPACQGGSRPGS